MACWCQRSEENVIQFTQTHQNWTIEDWKNVAWSDESRFLDSDSRVRIWRKEHESMDPSCLVESMPQIIKAVLKAKVGPNRY